jgi:CMP-2-keto-3-deoxyoctulosonic acid synthetase
MSVKKSKNTKHQTTKYLKNCKKMDRKLCFSKSCIPYNLKKKKLIIKNHIYQKLKKKLKFLNFPKLRLRN